MLENVSDNFKKSLLGRYTKNLIQLMPKNVTMALFLMVLISLVQGVSLLLLVPLTATSGVECGTRIIGPDCKFCFNNFSLL